MERKYPAGRPKYIHITYISKIQKTCELSMGELEGRLFFSPKSHWQLALPLRLGYLALCCHLVYVLGNTEHQLVSGLKAVCSASN